MVKKKPQIKKIKKSSDYSRNKELYWVLGTMIVLIIVFVVSYFIFSSAKNFEYKGLTFTKEKLGKIDLYHYFYYFDNKGKTYQYNLYLRKDPRKNNVPITGNIVFSRGKFTYLSINGTGLVKCEDSTIAIAGLSNLLSSNFITIKVSTPDEEEAELNNLTYANCETHPERVTILIQEGSETKIEKEGMCHVISVANCEILEAIEKFEVQSILDAKDN